VEEDEVCGDGVMTEKLIPGWKYYNHAAIPTCAPHEVPDLTPVKDGRIWHIEGKKPLLVRYTTDWDCGYDTGWWYLIKEAPFDINILSSNSRKHIKEAFRKVRVEKIDPMLHIDELYECSHNAFLKYKNASNEPSRSQFEQECQLACEKKIEFWAGFDLKTEKIVGWLNVNVYDSWCEIVTAKFDPRYLYMRVSDALYASVLKSYLNECGKKYVSSGSRSIQHTTRTQEYKESHFGYRKCFCFLNIVYSKKMNFLVTLLYPFRRITLHLGKFVKPLHQISAIMQMEQIRRAQRRCL